MPVNSANANRNNFGAKLVDIPIKSLIHERGNLINYVTYPKSRVHKLHGFLRRQSFAMKNIKL